MKEKSGLVEKEIETLTQKIEGIAALQRELADLKLELKGLKLFLGRIHPEFKTQYLEIMRKIKD